MDLIGRISGLDPEDYDVLDSKDYFYFHAAAGKQREAILEKISGLTE